MHEHGIRNAARALIIKNNKLLTIKYRKGEGDIYYTLPGGGQNSNEELSSALKRECFEELGVKIEVKDIIFVCEYIADYHDSFIHKAGFHQVDLIFECQLTSNIDILHAKSKDGNQLGYEWIDIQNIESVIMYPRGLRKFILDYYLDKNKIIYVGEME
ncbi:NUDIX domain-containing protein [Abyssisolibacter fermentans]|uniref:NUDIX domain-containing protein n=1 Tax=Abyssisolibacter fermentans TaxID=1766203 RepID=UPI000833803E|nr:NUDIX domain-containing protein [Abyssisolibacter fermentans]